VRTTVGLVVSIRVPDHQKPNVLQSILDKTIVADETGHLKIGYWTCPVQADDICMLLRSFPGVTAEWR
jgi:hypothetical protein